MKPDFSGWGRVSINSSLLGLRVKFYQQAHEHNSVEKEKENDGTKDQQGRAKSFESSQGEVA